MDNIKVTINYHYYWLNLRDNICTHFKVCKTCQKSKKNPSKMEIYSLNEVETIHWDRVLVYLIEDNTCW